MNSAPWTDDGAGWEAVQTCLSGANGLSQLSMVTYQRMNPVGFSGNACVDYRYVDA